MLKNFWWPLEFSHVVKYKPMRVTALEQECVLYRTPDGAAHVLSDLCVHRGGALSDGWMQGDCIGCPYHGWEYKAGESVHARVPDPQFEKDASPREPECLNNGTL